jgi:hypothetical protein
VLGKRTVALFVVIAAVGSSCPAADYYFFFTTTNKVSLSQPETTLTLWAAFDPELYAFAGSHTSILGFPDAGGFSDPTVLLLQDYYCDPGAVSPGGDSILDISFLQLHNLGGLYAQTDNPIALWSATWSSTDFTPREVAIATQTTDFRVYYTDIGVSKDYYGDDFAEAQGFISVGYDGCYPDFTADGLLDLFDFLAYFNAFNAQDPGADCDRNGDLDLFDFLCFTNTFNEGC